MDTPSVNRLGCIKSLKCQFFSHNLAKTLKTVLVLFLVFSLYSRQKCFIVIGEGPVALLTNLHS